MDEEKEDQPPFRWNPQAVFMLFFFMLAMAVPLGGVVWFARGYLSAQQQLAKPAPAAAVDTKALEQGLEHLSDEHFASTTSIDTATGLELEVAKEDQAARLARIKELAVEAGGSALDLSDPAAAGRRLMLQVPASRSELLMRAIRGDRVDFSTIPAGAATQMLEVKLKAP